MTMTATHTIEQIPAELIHAGDKTNDRKHFDPAALEQLAASIATSGLAQAPVVRPMADGTFEIVAGERRCRAMIDLLGWAEVPCSVRVLTDEEASTMTLLENMARADLSVIEEANAYQGRLDRGWSISDLSERCGVPRRRIESRLRLLRLAPDVQHLVASSNVSLRDADQLVGLDVNRQRLALAGLQGGLDSRGFTVLVARLRGEQDSETMFDPDSFFQVAEYVGHAQEIVEAEQLGLFSQQIEEATSKRNAGIRAMRANGATYQAIAAVVGLTHPAVRTICLAKRSN
jgi:ParB/RepB/Spo0J family partition protein